MLHHKPPVPLRLLLVTDRGTIPNWLYKCLEAVEGSNAATVVLALHAARVEKRILHRLLFSLYERIDRYLFRTVPDALAAIDLRSAFPKCRVVDLRHTSLARALEAAHIDLVLDPFSLIPDSGVADRATYGVWSVPFGHHDDPRTQSTPAFWEVIDGSPSTETRLCIQWRGSDRKRLLYWSVAPTDRHSVSRSQNHVYWKISAALSRNIQRLSEDPDAFVERFEASAPVDVADGPSAAPGNLEMLRAGTSLVRRYAADRWMSTLYREQWALAYQHGGNNRRLTGALQTLIPPTDRYWADPFPIRVQNDYYIFHEELPFSTGKGSIVLSIVDDKGNTAGPIPVLEKDYHLSYPFVFQWDRELFMIPETSSHRQVELYRCVTFPSRWKLERVLLTGVRALDPTPAFLFGRWWLFTAIPVHGAVYRAATAGELHLFYADSPLGPWTPHRANPVKSDVRSARPAGRVFEQDGQFYRPAQDCSRRYGYAVSINRILQLDPEAYAEVEADRIVPNGEPTVAGVHTFNVADDMTVIDCLVRRKKFWTDPWRRTLQLDRVDHPGSTNAAAVVVR